MRNDNMIPFQMIDLTKGFWYDRQQLNRNITLEAVRNQFLATGRFDALNMNWQQGMPNEPHIFFDSDVAKWIESAAYVLEKGRDAKIEMFIDQLIDLIGEKQMDEGYFNSWFQRFAISDRFTKRTDHELYCAGHFIEAAVAYQKATGKKKLTEIMCKYVDLIDRTFRIEGSAKFTTPGHEEIEVALIKLGDLLGDQKYTDLGIWFVEQRGQKPEDEYDFAKPNYAQDQAPVRDQQTAEGHSVRALYLYMAMADVALKLEDEKMLEACKRLFLNIVDRRMYITGGVGQSRFGEAFTIDYDLINTTAYTESCAAIALMLFARRLSLMEADGLYADIAERVMYNGFLSSTSLDGIRFFYENPLEIELARYDRDKSVKNGEVLPIAERVEVFGCSCCPPNITRLIASIGDFLYTASDDVLFVHHFMSSVAKFEVGGREVEISQQTNYPIDGKIDILVKGLKGKQLAIRVPGWCDDYRIEMNGQLVNASPVRGYVYLDCAADQVSVTADFMMDVQLIVANANVRDDAGRAALMRGPIVYCIEGVDNPGGLNTLMIDAHLDAQHLPLDFCPLPGLSVRGWRRALSDPNALYQKLQSAKIEPARLRLIPYYAFANRGASDMQTWVLVRQ